MGKTIERIALGRGHEIVCTIDIDNPQDFDSDAFRSADVAIEFTTPATAVDNYYKAFEQGVPVVSGSTGWTARMPEIKALCDEGKATFFWTSNYSLGVNLFFALNKYLGQLMDNFNDYTPSMKEIHHIQQPQQRRGQILRGSLLCVLW